ncbi:MAG: helix-turn-helix transcriptional regulator [Brevundimonas sp.]|nr:helix-turn-helix transcriptional regulator [Brevundimonas sp.]
MARVQDVGPHPVDQHVGRRIQAQRVAAGYSQSELGQALGLTFQQVQKYERGVNRVSASKLWEIAAFLKVEIGYFFQEMDADARPLAGEAPARHPLTRATVEISNLAPRLSVRRQKLIADLMRNCLGDAPPVEDPELSGGAARRTGAAETEARSRQD